MFPCLSPWTASPNKPLTNQSEVFNTSLSFVAILSALNKGLDGHMPPVNKALVRYVDWTLSPQLN